MVELVVKFKDDAKIKPILDSFWTDPATAKTRFEAWKANRPEFARLKIYRCPMTKSSFPGAPARAEWLQLTGPLRNPYFGAEMPECGTEVAP